MDNSSVVIREVMLRDGLQNIPEFIPTEAKIKLFQLIVASGLRNIEITSFVSPKAIPQFQDSVQMAQAVLKMKPKGVEVSALIPNLRGAQIALESGMRKLGLVMSVSESHNINNVRRTTAESIDEVKRILELREKYPDLDMKIGLATVFGCPFEGKIKPEVTLHFIRQFYQLGFRGISMADTVGFGNPREVKEMSRLCVTEFPEVTFSIHLHNTRGLGLANSLAALESGIRIHDGAIGGLGGCPFAPGAKGNTSTEDLVFMFEEMGVSTGVKMDALMEASRYFQSVKKDVRYSSSILEVGVPVPKGAITKDGSEQKWNM
ncbi:MAG TPA: hydroxymethylglutaryl-CoA lyase [Thermodesulfobacteriota bacterium]|nr:hydroxymethylglutaryl-CoA lyase [Thermodesulfobacteriota bacterium]